MLMMTAKTDAKGMATFEKVPFGTYTLVETQALPGYLKADTEIRLTVDGTFVNPKEPIATVTNEQQKIRGLKVDTAGQALPGAAFSLINADTGEIVDVAASDEKGEFYLTGFGCDDWIIRETVAPEGFNRVEDVLIHVDEDWKAPNTLLFTDIPNHYEFIKVDEDGCPMEGVKFALEDEDGNVLRELGVRRGWHCPCGRPQARRVHHPRNRNAGWLSPDGGNHPRGDRRKLHRGG